MINSVKKIANCYPIIETSTVIERSRVPESSLNLNNTRHGIESLESSSIKDGILRDLIMANKSIKLLKSNEVVLSFK